jgi:hypothetical protein
VHLVELEGHLLGPGLQGHPPELAEVVGHA